jgi:acetyl esterase/lipase
MTRYKEMIFQEYTVEKDLSWRSPAGHASMFDLYQPKNDSAHGRPLIIWMHGGGFKFGSRDASGTRLWCQTFARRGYVCAAINYTLGKKNFSFTFTQLARNCYQAVQDVRQALSYLKLNAARWGIDTTKIVLAGNSAGGMLALQAVYCSDAQLKGLLGKDGTAGLSPAINPQKVAAIINFWGGIFDTAWLRQTKVPIVSVHGEQDRIVPYDHKGYPLYGSLPIHRMADSLQIPNALKSYPGYSHELQKQFNPLIISRQTKKRWLEAGEFAADFLYKTLWE